MKLIIIIDLDILKIIYKIFKIGIYEGFYEAVSELKAILIVMFTYNRLSKYLKNRLGTKSKTVVRW
jgi:hypothetical protein